MPRLPIRTCDLYTPGHQVHWIPPLRVYVDAPRRPVRVEDLTPDGWCTVLDGGQVLRWWNHDPLRLADLVALADGQMLRVGDSTFLTTPVRDGSCYWIYLAEDGDAVPQAAAAGRPRRRRAAQRPRPAGGGQGDGRRHRARHRATAAGPTPEAPGPTTVP